MSSYITSKKSNVEFSLSHIYYNVNIVNANNNGDIQNITCRYQESRDVALVDNPSEWACSVIRFACNTQLIPLMIMPIRIGQPNINLSTFNVVIFNSSDLQYSEAPVIYTPANQAKLPQPPIPNQDVSNDYYYIYHYQDLIGMVNIALQTAYNNITTKPVGSSAPYFMRDNAGYLNLVAGSSYANNGGTLRIYINENLYKYFGAFQNFFISSQIAGLTNIRYHWLTVQDDLNGNVNNGVYTMKQDYPTTSNWSVFQRLSLISNIPIIPEATPQSQPFNSNGNVQDKGISSQKLILTDFQAHGNDVFGWESNLQVIYSPTGQYRYLDMCSNQPLKSLDLQVFWDDIYGNTYPLFLAPNSSFNCKIMFRKKSNELQNIII
jgi:hypothetical protein